MKKYQIGVAVLLLLGGVLCLATGSQAQAPAYRGANGHLKLYPNNIDGCSGTTSNPSGYMMQYSTDGGSHWTDFVTTGSGGAFLMNPYVSGFRGTMSIQSKPNCGDTLDQQNDEPCNTTSFPYAFDSQAGYTTLTTDNTAYACAANGGPIH